tara:strand:+ start:421 stop:588 length:168 start_codon:yes stop_codon:yes gene_type:complete
MLMMSRIDLMAITWNRVVDSCIDAGVIESRNQFARIIAQNTQLMPGMFGIWPDVR